VGHSLGGAVAQIAALDSLNALNELNMEKIEIITIGSPRVGNRAFSEWASGIFKNKHKRVVNQDDLCPHLPPTSVNFMHASNEIWIMNDEGDTVECFENDVEASCSNKFMIHDIGKHGYAWNYPLGIGSCMWDDELNQELENEV
jgi:hypothetical protein